MAEKHIKKYPNGATLIYYRQNINSTTDVTMGFLCGSRFDPKGKEGTAHAVEHSIFNNLIAGMDEPGLYNFFKKTGTIHNAFTTNDVVATTFNTPNKNFEAIFKIDSEMFANHKFNENRWAKERKAILQEIYMVLDEKGISSLEANRSAKTRDKILGTPYSLNRITAKDLEEYADTRFITDNMIISVVSSLPYNEVKKVVEENFINKFPSNAKRKIDIKKQTYDFESKLNAVDEPYANSFVIEFVFKGLDGVEKNDLMTRFENWYFNEFAGKLYERLRYKNQLVYTSSFLSLPVLNSNLKAFEITTSPENANRCIEVLSEILREAIKNGVSEEDFALFKQAMLEKRARKTNIKTYQSEKLFNDYVYGKKSFVRNFFNKLMSLDRETVNKYLKDVYGKSNLMVAYVGDMAKAQNIKLIGKNGVMVPVDHTYPINVVSDEQIVKDYLSINPLYTLDDILILYRYWDEYRLQILKAKMDSECYISKALTQKPNTKVPRISQSKINKAIVRTFYNKRRIRRKNTSKTTTTKSQNKVLELKE